MLIGQALNTARLEIDLVDIGAEARRVIALGIEAFGAHVGKIREEDPARVERWDGINHRTVAGREQDFFVAIGVEQH